VATQKIGFHGDDQWLLAATFSDFKLVSWRHLDLKS